MHRLGEFGCRFKVWSAGVCLSEGGRRRSNARWQNRFARILVRIFASFLIVRRVSHETIEKKQNDLNPKFTTTIEMPYFFEGFLCSFVSVVVEFWEIVVAVSSVVFNRGSEFANRRVWYRQRWRCVEESRFYRWNLVSCSSVLIDRVVWHACLTRQKRRFSDARSRQRDVGKFGVAQDRLHRWSAMCEETASWQNHDPLRRDANHGAVWCEIAIVRHQTGQERCKPPDTWVLIWSEWTNMVAVVVGVWKVRSVHHISQARCRWQICSRSSGQRNKPPRRISEIMFVIFETRT